MGGTLSKPDPSRTLEVIGAGYPRTGTSSMQLAFERLLDGPAYHCGTQFYLVADVERCNLWGKACESKFQKHDKELTLKLVKEAIKGYVAISDIWAFLLLPELVELFPNAKVVLNVRDPQKCFDSLGNMLNVLFPWYYKPLLYPVPGLRWASLGMVGFAMQLNPLLTKAGYQPGEMGPHSMDLWTNEVIRIVPKERLLIMDVKEGWEPLAKFLGKPVPKNEPFPRVNEKAAFERQTKLVVGRVLKYWAGLISVTGAVAGSTYLAWQHWRT